MMKFSYDRFRELCDLSDAAVLAARTHPLPESALLSLSAQHPNGTELFTWDRDRIVWLSAIINLAEIGEAIPFITRRGCLTKLIEEHSEELMPRYIRHINGGIAMHPAVYYASGNAEIIGTDDKCIDFESFNSCLLEWVQLNGY